MLRLEIKAAVSRLAIPLFVSSWISRQHARSAWLFGQFSVWLVSISHDPR